jgi:peptide-methionine (S)-S-oxide reductase
MKKILFLWGLLIVSTISEARLEKAILAGGCFWCLESDFDKLPGIISTVSGFDGGQSSNPSYAYVSSGNSGYVEVVEITFDTDTISYKEILDHFWKHVDPTDAGGQFCDRGPQYRTVIFYTNENQKEAALQSKKEITDLFEKAGLQVHTEVLPSTNFTAAEEYHQNYHNKNPIRYWYYRKSCGRDKTVEQIWGKIKDENN